jgi:hypothetical protein
MVASTSRPSGITTKVPEASRCASRKLKFAGTLCTNERDDYVRTLCTKLAAMFTAYADNDEPFPTRSGFDS